MDDSYMIGKMNTFMHRLAEQMSGWLGTRLPKLTDEWWRDLVYNNLSQLQRDQVDQKNITELKGLDLAALLRVFDRNWFVITSSWFVNNKERQKIRDMMGVRNSWAHISSEELSKEKVISDVEIIIELMQIFDAKMSETRDMEQFIMDVEEDKDIQDKPAQAPVQQVVVPLANPTPAAGDIVAGSMVTLVSDPSKAGAVIAVDNGKYTVWMDNAPQTFYREQIQLKAPEVTSAHLALSRVRSALTAYQINNPSSSNLYSLNSARIDFVPYQFRPALKMIKADSPRLLVADDVGVGKTIEAGLILKEMEARSSINSVLIICPRPLVAERKWELEMKRFDENFTQLDGKELLECISETDRDGEWPERHKKTIIPYSLFGEDMLAGTESTSDKKRKQKGLLQLDPVPHFDLVIVDEAHNIRNSNTWAYQGVELFTRAADAVVFLTATPLQNSNNDLYTLLNLLRPDVVLDKDTFQTMAEPNAYINGLLRAVRHQEEGWQETAKEEILHILETTWGRNVIQHNPNFAQVFELVDKGVITREEKVEAISLIESLHSFNSLITRTRMIRIEKELEYPITVLDKKAIRGFLNGLLLQHRQYREKCLTDDSKQIIQNNDRNTKEIINSFESINEDTKNELLAAISAKGSLQISQENAIFKILNDSFGNGEFYILESIQPALHEKSESLDIWVNMVLNMALLNGENYRTFHSVNDIKNPNVREDAVRKNVIFSYLSKKTDEIEAFNVSGDLKELVERISIGDEWLFSESKEVKDNVECYNITPFSGLKQEDETIKNLQIIYIFGKGILGVAKVIDNIGVRESNFIVELLSDTRCTG